MLENVLSRSGVFAAFAVGALALRAGPGFVLILLGFFISSTALSGFRRIEKEKLHAGIVAKGNARDASQVLANGGVFSLACLWYIISQNPAAIFMAAGALSAAAADTWATEIGSLSSTGPRSILTGHAVPAGTSGGVTLLGALAAVAASLFIALLGLLAGWEGLFLACTVAGVAGAAVDSITGASIQCRRWCAACSQHTEREVHLCGASTSHVSGVSWINNDAVNLFCTLVGAAIALLWVL